MSTISGVPTAARGETGHSRAIGLGATLKRWWVAYITWRTQEAAIARLWSMTERELKDIGLTRSEISRAAKGGATRDRAFSRYY